MRDGAPMLRAFLENAEPFPIRGLLRCVCWLCLKRGSTLASSCISASVRRLSPLFGRHHPLPLPRSFHEYYDDIIKYYRLEHKDGQGRSTGWPTLDQYYKVGGQQWTRSTLYAVFAARDVQVACAPP